MRLPSSLSTSSLSTSLSTLVSRRPGKGERGLWLIPLGIAVVLLFIDQKDSLEIMGACIALGLMGFMVNRPGGTLLTLMVFLPFEGLGFSLLYRNHVPGGFLREASGIKELMALTILLAGLRQIRDSGRKFDRIDIALLMYVAVVTAYLIAPHVFSSFAPTELGARLAAWRSDCGYALVFFGTRHVAFKPGFRQTVIKVVLSLGFATGVVGIYQRLDPTGFSNFCVNTAHLFQYQQHVIGSAPSQVAYTYAYITQISPLRVSSYLLSPFDCADFMTIVCAICAVRISQNGRSPINYIVFGTCGATLFFTQVRADFLALVIVLVLIALPISKTPVEGRIRLIGALLVAVVVIVPSLAGTRLAGNKATQASSTGHVTEITNGINIIKKWPLGLGLGEQPGVAIRLAANAPQIDGGDISDNMITQVGDELGLQALLPWLLMMIFIGIAFKRRAASGDTFAAAIGFGFLCICLDGQYHHVFLNFPIPWTIWACAGLALSAQSPNPYEELDAGVEQSALMPGVR
jgi:hypothetical protein